MNQIKNNHAIVSLHNDDKIVDIVNIYLGNVDTGTLIIILRLISKTSLKDSIVINNNKLIKTIGFIIKEIRCFPTVATL